VTVLAERDNVRATCAVAALTVAIFTFVTVEELPIGLLTLISADLEVSLSAVGLLVTGYALVVMVASVPLTRVTRRIPRRHLLAGLLAVFIVATWVSAVAASYWVLLAARITTALTHAVFWSIVVPAAAGLFSPRVRGRVVAFVLTGGSMAIVLGVPAGTWLGQQFGWRMAFVAASGLSLLTFVAIAALLPTAKPEDSHAATGVEPDARRYWIVVVATAVAVGGVFTAYTYVTPFLTQVAGFSAAAISPLLLVNGLAGFAGNAAAGAAADRRPREALMAAVALHCVALFGLYLFSTVRPLVVGLLALTGFSLAGMATALSNRVLVVAPGSSDIASAGSSAAFNAGIAGGALVGGALLPNFGVLSTVGAGGLLCLVAFVVLVCEPLMVGRSGPAGQSDDARPAGRGPPQQQQVELVR
jgi:MFS transporter, DHA1 family, inner membrane transport protein